MTPNHKGSSAFFICYSRKILFSLLVCCAWILTKNKTVIHSTVNFLKVGVALRGHSQDCRPQANARTGKAIRTDTRYHQKSKITAINVHSFRTIRFVDTNRLTFWLTFWWNDFLLWWSLDNTNSVSYPVSTGVKLSCLHFTLFYPTQSYGKR